MKKLIFSTLVISTLLAGGAWATTAGSNEVKAAGQTANAISFPVNPGLQPAPVQKSDWKGCYTGHKKPEEPKNYYDVPYVTMSGKVPTLAQAKAAVMRSAASKEWTVLEAREDGKNGKFVMEKNVKNKHALSVHVYYNGEKYTIVYRSSENLAESVCSGRTFIHRNYNVWVNQLKTAIAKELQSL